MKNHSKTAVYLDLMAVPRGISDLLHNNDLGRATPLFGINGNNDLRFMAGNFHA